MYSDGSLWLTVVNDRANALQNVTSPKRVAAKRSLKVGDIVSRREDTAAQETVDG